ncbi:MAG: hypothetical protein WKF73_02305 [Nocardioidaceae bacterium]
MARRATAAAASGLLVAAVAPSMVSAQAQSAPGAAAVTAATGPTGLNIPDKAPKAGAYDVVLADQTRGHL